MKLSRFGKYLKLTKNTVKNIDVYTPGIRNLGYGSY